MTGERWGDRVVTRICQLCARTGPRVRPGWACWSDESQPCMAMDRCYEDRDRCRELAELAGIRWPDGLVAPSTRRLPALVEGGNA